MKGTFPKANKRGEAYTENCAGRREFAAPESWYSFEMPIEIDEGFNVSRSQHRSIRNGNGCEGSPESSGCGMYKEMQTRTWEAH